MSCSEETLEKLKNTAMVLFRKLQDGPWSGEEQELEPPDAGIAWGFIVDCLEMVYEGGMREVYSNLQEILENGSLAFNVSSKVRVYRFLCLQGGEEVSSGLTMEEAIKGIEVPQKTAAPDDEDPGAALQCDSELDSVDDSPPEIVKKEGDNIE